jgi:Ulp1 family protease
MNDLTQRRPLTEAEEKQLNQILEGNSHDYDEYRDLNNKLDPSEGEPKPSTHQSISLRTELLKYSKFESVLVMRKNIPLTAYNFQCLERGRWLNDEVINFFIVNILPAFATYQCRLKATKHTFHFFSSFFMERVVDSQTKQYHYPNVQR